MSGATTAGLLKLPFKGLHWTFAVGIGWTRTVTVIACDHETALDRARSLLDKRAERSGQEAPVAWDLFLVQARRVE